MPPLGAVGAVKDEEPQARLGSMEPMVQVLEEQGKPVPGLECQVLAAGGSPSSENAQEGSIVGAARGEGDGLFGAKQLQGKTAVKVKVELDSDSDLPGDGSGKALRSILTTHTLSAGKEDLQAKREPASPQHQQVLSLPSKVDLPNDEQPRKRLARKMSGAALRKVKQDPQAEGAGDLTQPCPKHMVDWASKGSTKDEVHGGAHDADELKDRTQEFKLGLEDERASKLGDDECRIIKGDVKQESTDAIDTVKHEGKGEVKSEVEEECESRIGLKKCHRTQGVVKEEPEGAMSGEDVDTVNHESTGGVKSEAKHVVRAEATHVVKSEIAQTKVGLDHEEKCPVKQEGTDRDMKEEFPEEGARRVKDERCIKGEAGQGGKTAKVKRRINCKQGSVKPEVKRELPEVGQSSSVKRSWQQDDQQTTFAAHLPRFISECREFQIAKRTWAPARPCCPANSFFRPLGPPPGDGKSCYERLSKEQRRELKAYFEKSGAQVGVKRPRPDSSEPTASRKVPGQPRERLLVTPPQMKMWPWMRDLDVRWWIGCGWVLTADGPKRLSEGGAAPGTQLFEGRGQEARSQTPEEADEAVEASWNQNAKGSEAHAAAPSPPVPAAAADAPSAGGADPQPDRKKRVVRTTAKQSGVRNVSWDASSQAWNVKWWERGRRQNKRFSVHQLMERGGLSRAAADAEALREAVAFRESLAREGKLSEPPAGPRSSCQGVSWHSSQKRWRVRLTLPGDGKELHLSFRPKDDTPEEMEKARLAAVERMRELEREHVELRVREAVDPIMMQSRESGVPGVTWARGRWKSQMRINGVNFGTNFTAKDQSPGEIEAARLLAVQHYRGLERKRLEAKGAVGH